MREALILAGLTIGGVLTFFGDRPVPETSPSRAPVSALKTAVTKAGAPFATATAAIATHGGATELRRAADGHFYAGVTTNGRAITMLVDTGASVVALTGADARSVGLQWNPAQLDVVAQGASGPIRGVALTLDRVTLGWHEARDVQAVIIPEGLPISLLGQSFLATIEPVTIAKDRMVLGGPSSGA